MKNLQLTIASHNFNEFKKEFSKLQKMSYKMNLEIPNFTVISEGEKVVRYYDKSSEQHLIGSDFIINVFNIEINIAETLKFDGWSLFGTVHHREDVVDLIDIEEEMPSKYGCNYKVCEHCGGSHSNRVISFIVKNESEEFKQVGSTCVQQFMGVNPNHLYKFNAQLIIAISESFTEEEDEGGTFKMFGGVKDKDWIFKRKAYSVKEILNVALNTLEENDFAYVKKITVQNDNPPYQFIRTNEGEATVELMEAKIDAEDYIPADINTDYYNGLVSFLEKMEVEPPKYNEDESFTEKIQSLCNTTKVRRMDFWKCVWAILMYKSASEVTEKSNVHIGTVGEKSVFECTVIDFKEGQGTYGDWQLFIMEDKAGNSISKFGAMDVKFIDEQPDDYSYIGAKVRFTAMVKSHEVRNKRNVTMLGRLSMVKK